MTVKIASNNKKLYLELVKAFYTEPSKDEEIIGSFFVPVPRQVPVALKAAQPQQKKEKAKPTREQSIPDNNKGIYIFRFLDFLGFLTLSRE